ncbi:MAG: histidine--tRNA ligase [Microbacteriaceae bacterium]|nr:histidine--tRNA ligase [Microbacteriaceae bacterium]
MRDFLPADKAKREAVISKIRAGYAAHGFEEIETPVMESLERLHSGMGGDNEKLSYAIMKRGLKDTELADAAKSGNALALADLGLRYDLTVPLARFYATNQAALPRVFRAIQIAPVWRAERPQKGRFRQFVQCDIDILGEGSISAEAELIIAALDVFDSLGLKDFSIRINDRRLLSELLTSFGFAKDRQDDALITIDKQDKIGIEGVLKELAERDHSEEAIAGFKAFATRPMTMIYHPFGEAQIKHRLGPDFESEAIADLAAIGKAVAASGRDSEKLTFDPFLVRGMGYYTGTIFEVYHPELGYSLGGGGRYDKMIGRFSGSEVPAVGFSIGFERILDLLDDDASNSLKKLLLLDEGVVAEKLLSVKSKLMNDGFAVSVQPKPKNLNHTLELAKTNGFTSWAIVSTAGELSEVRELA